MSDLPENLARLRSLVADAQAVLDEANARYWPVRDEWIVQQLDAGVPAKHIAEALGLSKISDKPVYKRWMTSKQRGEERGRAHARFMEALSKPIRRDERLGAGLLVQIKNTGDRDGLWEVGSVAYQKMLDEWHGGGMFRHPNRPQVEFIGPMEWAQ